jgi:hypothetical protein
MNMSKVAEAAAGKAARAMIACPRARLVLEPRGRWLQLEPLPWAGCLSWLDGIAQKAQLWAANNRATNGHEYGPGDNTIACRKCGLESCYWDLEPCPNETHGLHS